MFIKITKYILISLIGAGIIVGATYYSLDSKYSKEKAELQNKIDTLTTQLSKKAADSKTTTSETEVTLPGIAFIPDVFSDAEKKELRNKLINPYLDYEDPKREKLAAIYLEKSSDAEPTHNYSYNYITLDGGWGGSVFGDVKNKTLEYWTPGCMGDCEFTAEYEKKYPEVVKAYKAAN